MTGRTSAMILRLNANQERPKAVQEFMVQSDESVQMPAGNAPGISSQGEIVHMFRSAARLTAQTLLLEIEGLTASNPDHQAGLEQEQAMAQSELSEGDASALADDDESAIQHYRNAWLHASSARLQALRSR